MRKFVSSKVSVFSPFGRFTLIAPLLPSESVEYAPHPPSPSTAEMRNECQPSSSDLVPVAMLAVPHDVVASKRVPSTSRAMRSS